MMDSSVITNTQNEAKVRDFRAATTNPIVEDHTDELESRDDHGEYDSDHETEFSLSLLSTSSSTLGLSKFASESVSDCGFLFRSAFSDEKSSLLQDIDMFARETSGVSQVEEGPWWWSFGRPSQGVSVVDSSSLFDDDGHAVEREEMDCKREAPEAPVSPRFESLLSCDTMESNMGQEVELDTDDHTVFSGYYSVLVDDAEPTGEDTTPTPCLRASLTNVDADSVLGPDTNNMKSIQSDIEDRSEACPSRYSKGNESSILSQIGQEVKMDSSEEESTRSTTSFKSAMVNASVGSAKMARKKKSLFDRFIPSHPVPKSQNLHGMTLLKESQVDVVSMVTMEAPTRKFKGKKPTFFVSKKNTKPLKSSSKKTINQVQKVTNCPTAQNENLHSIKEDILDSIVDKPPVSVLDFSQPPSVLDNASINARSSLQSEPVRLLQTRTVVRNKGIDNVEINLKATMDASTVSGTVSNKGTSDGSIVATVSREPSIAAGLRSEGSMKSKGSAASKSTALIQASASASQKAIEEGQKSCQSTPKSAIPTESLTMNGDEQSIYSQRSIKSKSSAASRKSMVRLSSQASKGASRKTLLEERTTAPQGSVKVSRSMSNSAKSTSQMYTDEQQIDFQRSIESKRSATSRSAARLSTVASAGASQKATFEELINDTQGSVKTSKSTVNTAISKSVAKPPSCLSNQSPTVNEQTNNVQAAANPQSIPGTSINECLSLKSQRTSVDQANNVESTVKSNELTTKPTLCTPSVMSRVVSEPKTQKEDSSVKTRSTLRMPGSMFPAFANLRSRNVKDPAQTNPVVFITAVPAVETVDPGELLQEDPKLSRDCSPTSLKNATQAQTYETVGRKASSADDEFVPPQTFSPLGHLVQDKHTQSTCNEAAVERTSQQATDPEPRDSSKIIVTSSHSRSICGSENHQSKVGVEKSIIEVRDEQASSLVKAQDRPCSGSSPPTTLAHKSNEMIPTEITTSVQSHPITPATFSQNNYSSDSDHDEPTMLSFDSMMTPDSAFSGDIREIKKSGFSFGFLCKQPLCFNSDNVQDDDHPVVEDDTLDHADNQRTKNSWHCFFKEQLHNEHTVRQVEEQDGKADSSTPAAASLKESLLKSNFLETACDSACQYISEDGFSDLLEDSMRVTRIPKEKKRKQKKKKKRRPKHKAKRDVTLSPIEEEVSEMPLPCSAPVDENREVVAANEQQFGLTTFEAFQAMDQIGTSPAPPGKKKKRSIYGMFKKKNRAKKTKSKETKDVLSLIQSDTFMVDIMNDIRMDNRQANNAVESNFIGKDKYQTNDNLPDGFSEMLVEHIAEEAVKICLEQHNTQHIK
jgi:hypothetical protein